MTVKIVHSGGNGVSIAPPDANPASDKTVKLPAANGTLLTTESSPSFRNLIINGAMQVAQRGTSSTTSASYTCDRFRVKWSGQDEVLTYSQHALTSSDTGPWAKGFRYSLHVQNGNQTSGAGAADYANINYRVEAQDVAGSGWDYTSASSYITLSFWVKSSVAQTFYFIITNGDGTTYNYPIETGSLTADTWTKVTKTIPGNSNLTINNDNGNGLEFDIQLFRGTDTTGSVTLNQWATFASATRCPDVTSTWWTTNDATFEITGVQLEIGETATEFEHRSYGDELRRCQRYYFKETAVTNGFLSGCGFACNATFGIVHCDFPVVMRAAPTALEQTGTAGDYKMGRRTAATTCSAVPAFDFANTQHAQVLWYVSTGMVAGEGVFMRTTTTDVYLAWSSEL
jgi:hypothetical protein